MRKQIPFNPENLTIYRPPSFITVIAMFAIFRGHSDEAEGAQSPTTGLSEFDYYGDVCHTAAEQLADLGVEVHLFERDKWGEFMDMVNHMNHIHRTHSPGYKGGVSLHLDCYNTRARGTTGLHWKTSKNGKLLAWHMSRPVNRLLQTKDRGLRGLTYGDNANIIVRETLPPWSILEAGYIDNAQDEAALRQHHNLMDEAIVTGAVNYLIARGVKSDRLMQWCWDGKTDLRQESGRKID